jgi:hypothetical protein
VEIYKRYLEEYKQVRIYLKTINKSIIYFILLLYKDLKKEFEIEGFETWVTADHEVYYIYKLLLMDPYEIEVNALNVALKVTKFTLVKLKIHFNTYI